MRQAQQAAEIRQKINDLVTGRTRIEQIFYYSGSYKTIEGDQLQEITGPEAAELLATGTRLYYIAEDRRTWDNDLNQFTGQAAEHPQLPEVPEGADVVNVHTSFEPEDYAKTFIRHPQWTNSN